MFEFSIPQDYGIEESIALVTNENAKRTELYQRIKLVFAQKFISFQDVTLDDYESVTIMQEDNRLAFPFLIITDGLTREILSAEKALQWIGEQKFGAPMYNGYILYYTDLPYEHNNSMIHYSDDTDEVVDLINTDFIEIDKDQGPDEEELPF